MGGFSPFDAQRRASAAAAAPVREAASAAGAVSDLRRGHLANLQARFEMIQQLPEVQSIKALLARGEAASDPGDASRFFRDAAVRAQDLAGRTTDPIAQRFLSNIANITQRQQEAETIQTTPGAGVTPPPSVPASSPAGQPLATGATQIPVDFGTGAPAQEVGAFGMTPTPTPGAVSLPQDGIPVDEATVVGTPGPAVPTPPGRITGQAAPTAPPPFGEFRTETPPVRVQRPPVEEVGGFGVNQARAARSARERERGGEVRGQLQEQAAPVFQLLNSADPAERTQGAEQIASLMASFGIFARDNPGVQADLDALEEQFIQAKSQAPDIPFDERGFRRRATSGASKIFRDALPEDAGQITPEAIQVAEREAFDALNIALAELDRLNLRHRQAFGEDLVNMDRIRNASTESLEDRLQEEREAAEASPVAAREQLIERAAIEGASRALASGQTPQDAAATLAAIREGRPPPAPTGVRQTRGRETLSETDRDYRRTLTKLGPGGSEVVARGIESLFPFASALVRDNGIEDARSLISDQIKQLRRPSSELSRSLARREFRGEEVVLPEDERVFDRLRDEQIAVRLALLLMMEQAPEQFGREAPPPSAGQEAPPEQPALRGAGTQSSLFPVTPRPSPRPGFQSSRGVPFGGF